jgi:hypothetical protein
MREVAGDHQNAQAERGARIHVLFADKSSEKRGERQAQIGEQQAADIVPGRAGGGQRSLLIRRIADDVDKRRVGDIADVPDHVGDDRRNDDDNGGEYLVVPQPDELEREDKGNDPRGQDEPRAVAAPFFGLGAVQNAAVDPGQAGVDDGEYRVDGRGDADGKTGNVREERHEIECLNVAHQHEAAVADAEEVLQRIRQGLLLLGFRFDSFLILCHK